MEKQNLNYVLELRNITKIFPGVVALDDVNLQLKKGEVLALVGENGAGKSTLINCITGVVMPEKGQIFVYGKHVVMKNPLVAATNGISVVHQERNLIPTFDIAENIFFDKICGGGGKLVNKKEMHRNAKALLEKVRLSIPTTASVETLSSAQKQLVEIARALSINSDIILFDEPTASISIKEAEVLFDIIRELKAQGVSIIFVSHKLEEIFRIADRVAVLRDGKSIGEATKTTDLDRDALVERMVGSREVKQAFPLRTVKDDYILEAENISTKLNPYPASFKLKKAEILGWYGLVGAGRTELAREIIGIDPIKKGVLRINGKPVRIKSYKDAFEKHSIYYLSENRKEEGLFLIHSIASNISSVALKLIKNKFGLNSSRKELELAQKYRDKIQIKMASPKNPVSSLSGGNQQKVCIAKCLITNPEIIIADEPTIGIDVKTKVEIYRILYSFAQQGKSVIFISSDLPELIQVSDRILVFRDKEIVGEFQNSKQYDVISAKVLNTILG